MRSRRRKEKAAEFKKNNNDGYIQSESSSGCLPTTTAGGNPILIVLIRNGRNVTFTIRNFDEREIRSGFRFCFTNTRRPTYSANPTNFRPYRRPIKRFVANEGRPVRNA